MSAERWQRLDRVFVDALQLPPERRAGFVAQACDGDHALQTEALSLLTAEGESGQFMNKPALEQLAERFSADGWSLRPGDRLGAYTVVRLLGSGGVGEVWRARDERLNRDVAIKVLLPHFATDADRLRRFADEARAAGAINHPNIVTVYDVGEHHGIPFLVSECLEGHSLRRRLDAGALSHDEAIAIGVGIARGLSAAHARGIVHRDLKPENTFVRSDGGVKILDFGLAKLQMPVDDRQTVTGHTATGAIVGTAGYMAPEQVKGEDIDARADLFAVGVMLYEMLGGRHPFKCANTIETLHAIVTADPPDVSTLNRAVPSSLARIVTRLLKKDRESRFQSAGDLAWALEQVSAEAGVSMPTTEPRTEAPVRRRARAMGWAVAAALSAAVLVTAWWLFANRTRELRTVPLAQFTWTLPAGTTLDSAPVVSPDSQSVAFVGKDATGSRIFVRRLDSLEPMKVAGTDGGKQPFWAPDSKSLGFFARGHLMRVALAGGAPASVADAPDGRGGAWSTSGVIVFAPDLVQSGLARVSATGGTVEAATLLDETKGDNSHRWPVFLPDGIHFLYFNRASVDARRGVYVGRIDRPASTPESPLFHSESEAVYASIGRENQGVLLSVANGRTEARRFDPERLTIVGDARTVGLNSGENTPYHPMMLTASADLLAAATPGVPYGYRLESIGRTGEGERVWQGYEAQSWPRVSPDGHRLAWQRIDAMRGNPDIWIEDVDRGSRVRVTTSPDPDMLPFWSPDGTRLAFVNGRLPGRTGPRMLTIAYADGSGVIRTFPCPRECYPTDWTSDGRDLVVNVAGEKGVDVWALRASDGSGARPLLDGPYNERDARISPDGQWIAYVSDESGRPEVSVRRLTGHGARIVISSVGGDQPVWRRDGAELFFVNPEGRLATVAVHHTNGGGVSFDLPVQLPVPPIGFGHFGTQYDVSPDGQIIYFLRSGEREMPRQVNLVMGWRALLKGPTP